MEKLLDLVWDYRCGAFASPAVAPLRYRIRFGLDKYRCKLCIAWRHRIRPALITFWSWAWPYVLAAVIALLGLLAEHAPTVARWLWFRSGEIPGSVTRDAKGELETVFLAVISLIPALAGMLAAGLIMVVGLLARKILEKFGDA